MKRTLSILFISLFPLIAAVGQERITHDDIKKSLSVTKEKMEAFDKETMLDSLDQEQLPRLVSGGVLGAANMSNFIIVRNHKTMSSYMRVGGEIGGFLDFRITKHFSIQPQVLFTAHENYFAVTDSANHLWSFGMEIPVYFLGRYGNLQQGYLQFGGGLFTHFTFASNIAHRYSSVDVATASETPASDGYDYSSLYSLHNNHFGVCLTIGYEFRNGIQINAHYKVSLSDIAGFYREMKGQAVADALIYPQSVSLGIGYRWRYSPPVKETINW